MDAAPLVPDPLMSLAGALLAVFITLGLVCFGRLAFNRWTNALDPAARIGAQGLLGLGAAGTITFLVGLVSTGVAALIPLALGLFGFIRCGRDLMKSAKGFAKPQGPEWLAVLALGIAFLMAFVVLLAPSNAGDWDSIAYHMALPKLYNSLGHIERARFSSHSAFPEAVEMLFLLPLKWGLQSGAKAILLCYSALGSFALFGLARERYSRAAGWWAAAAFMTTPVVLWESASAYVDVAHGLFAGLGVIFAFRSAFGKEKDWILAGLLLGFACGTKYNGIQTVGVTLIILAVLAARKTFEGGWKPLALVAGIALVVGCPWYVKNIITTGNPVYPFLYEQFHGVDWDQKRADIYRVEQLGFGVGVSPQHKDWPELGNAVFGLAYQPGKYVNVGEPLGAVGIAFFAGLLFWAVAKKPRGLEASLLAFALLSFVLWFALSQQSRYATTLAIPASLLIGGAAASGMVGRIVAAAVACQALYTLGLYKIRSFDSALQVAVGKVAPIDYLHETLHFSEAAEGINALPGDSKIALYDQVFGYYLDKSYFWANPGHSSMIPYDDIRGGREYVDALRKLGFTHIYTQFVDKDTDPAFESALAGQTQLPAKIEQDWRVDWTKAWKVYLIEGIALRDITLVKAYKGGALFAIKPG